ncbi:MAG: chromate transporter [Spirochaetota bacterium]|nr:chromate transporter [Spirochaetota bacterium]
MIRELIKLYMIFFRIGLFSIGGGYVMLPMLRREMVEDRGWLTDDELIDYYAIAQATPGIIAVNTATFVGYKRRGVPGAVASTAGMVSPSLIIITVIAIFFTRFQDIPAVQRAFRGVRVAVAVLLSFTVASLIKKTVRSALEIILAVGAFLGVSMLGISPIPILIIAALCGVAAGAIRSAGKGAGEGAGARAPKSAAESAPVHGEKRE